MLRLRARSSVRLEILRRRGVLLSCWSVSRTAWRAWSRRPYLPTIGIGAGPFCDGQVLVIHDILGLCEKYSPKFVRQYADVKSVIAAAAARFSSEVKEGEFPTEEHSFA